MKIVSALYESIESFQIISISCNIAERRREQNKENILITKLPTIA
jgi:hypothetical protein